MSTKGNAPDELPPLPPRYDSVFRLWESVDVWNADDMHAYARAAIASALAQTPGACLPPTGETF